MLREQEQFAYFTARGIGDLTAVTDAVGIQPSRTYLSDDLNPTTRRTYGVSEWRLESGHEDTEPLSLHIDSLLLWLNRRPSALRDLHGDFDLTIHCVLYSRGHNIGLSLNSTQTQQLGRLGIGVDFDAYSSAVDRS